MKQTDDKNVIDELLLNVLGSEFFKSRNIPVCFQPVLPKSIRQANEK